MIVLKFNVGDWVNIIEPNIKGRVNKIIITKEVLYSVEYWEEKSFNSICCYEDELDWYDNKDNHEKNIVVTPKRKVKGKDGKR